MSAREPIAVPAPRIEPLATLPVFYKLAGRKVVLAGSSEGALWKAELLAAAGAELHVFSNENPRAFDALSASPPAGNVRVHARRWRKADLAGATLAIGDFEVEEECAAFVAAARRAGAAVNIIDKPEHCAFQFGAIVNRSPLVIGISTDGAAPVFGQAIRTRIETLLPAGLKRWAEAARDWRPALQARALGFALRRRFWEAFTALALAEPSRAPSAQDRAELLGEIDAAAARPKTGRVTLVGAGPGDPELLTMKAIRALQSADIILYDDLVSPGVLELARREARRMLVGKTGHGPSCRQDDINKLMVKLAREGRHVVRLKSGDPAVFGRATEEIEACRRAGIPVAIVPGITAAQGAAASLGVSLTERRVARRLQFITGHGQDGRLPQDIDWASIADPAATTVIYMPRRTLPALRDAALRHGLDPATPAVVMSNISRADERRIAGAVASLPELAGTLDDAGPALVLIGHALATAARAGDDVGDRHEPVQARAAG